MSDIDVLYSIHINYSVMPYTNEFYLFCVTFICAHDFYCLKPLLGIKEFYALFNKCCLQLALAMIPNIFCFQFDAPISIVAVCYQPYTKFYACCKSWLYVLVIVVEDIPFKIQVYF